MNVKRVQQAILDLIALFTLVAVFIIVFFSCTSCVTWSKPKPFSAVLSAPSAIKGAVIDEYAVVATKLMHAGYVVPPPHMLVVVLVKGEKKITGDWAWKEGGYYKAGDYTPYRLRIAYNPNSGSDISRNALRHELAHYILRQLGIDGHPANLDGVLYQWAEARKLFGS